MGETPTLTQTARKQDPPTGTSDSLAAARIRGKSSGEIPPVSLSNRKTTTHFKEGEFSCAVQKTAN